jgi:hypothetical protein
MTFQSTAVLVTLLTPQVSVFLAAVRALGSDPPGCAPERKSPHAERAHAKAGRRARVERAVYRLALELTEALAGCTENSSEER